MTLFLKHYYQYLEAGELRITSNVDNVLLELESESFALDVDGNKIVLTGFFKELERRVMMLSFNKSNGNISIDESFGKGDSFGSGLIIDRKEWPHGEEGAAMAHGAIFWPAARPDWD